MRLLDMNVDAVWGIVARQGEVPLFNRFLPQKRDTSSSRRVHTSKLLVKRLKIILNTATVLPELRSRVAVRRHSHAQLIHTAGSLRMLSRNVRSHTKCLLVLFKERPGHGHGKTTED